MVSRTAQNIHIKKESPNEGTETNAYLFDTDVSDDKKRIPE